MTPSQRPTAVLFLTLLLTAGCASSFVAGPVGPKTPSAAALKAADALEANCTKGSQTGPCWIAFVAADGLTEVRQPSPFVPEGVQIYRQCLDPQWPYGLDLGNGIIVACGTRRGSRP